MPVSDCPTNRGLRPLPFMARTPVLEGSPPGQAQQENGQATPPTESESSDADEFYRARATPPTRSENSDSDESHSAQSTFDQSEDFEFDSAPSWDELTQEILTYLQQSMLETVYGDFLSGSRTRRYESKWPMELEEIDTPLQEPASREEANSMFQELFAPLRRWYTVSRGTPTTPDSLYQRQKILAELTEHRQNRDTKPPPERCSGNNSLYRNLPDAAIELNVWSAINSAHVAIRRQSWAIADRRVTRAMLLASKLHYEPLVAKCWYWRGLIADGLQDRKTAAECFLSAMPCVGVYEEGELLSVPVAEYKLELLELLDQQEASEGETEWSKKVRRGITGINGWFVPQGNVQLRGSNAWDTELPLQTDHPREDDVIDPTGEGTNPTEQSFNTTGEDAQSKPLPEEHAEDPSAQSEENDGPVTYSYRTGGLRKMDWTLN